MTQHLRKFAVVGVVLIGVGILLPTVWYDTIPVNPDVPPPFMKGVTLLQCVTVLQGVILIAFSWFRPIQRIPVTERIPVRSHPEDAGGISQRASLQLLVAITTLAFVLRFVELGADFWIDEIRATLDAREMPLSVVIGSYMRSNVHLLNTLLMKLSMSLFGESEWSARLPAAVFGVATVPALYRVSRDVASREVSLGAALLLTVSYHHVFFSQNARGYVPYIFFTLVSSALLLQAFRDDRPRTWVLYAASTVLNFATILISGFVFAAHILVGAMGLVVVYRSGRAVRPMARRLALVFGGTGFLGFQLYAMQLPQAVSYLNATYAAPESGYTLLSREFVAELARGLSAGFGPGLILGALPVLALAGFGFLVFVRRQWILAWGLTSPLILTAALLVARGLTVSPRFFLLALPVAFLTAALTVEMTIGRAGGWLGWGDRARRRIFGGAMLLLAGLSMASLGRYYATPKQPYTASLEYAASMREPGDVVVAVHTSRQGVAYYGPGLGLALGEDLFLADSLEDLDSIVAEAGPGGAILLTSMPRALRILRPDMQARIEGGWTSSRTFAATIGDGQISVWTPRGR
jgi:mannosyltransferase